MGVSSAISLIDDSEDESDQTLASDNEDSDKENNDDVNELQESIYAEPDEVLSQENMSVHKQTKFKRRSQLPAAKRPTMRYRDSSSESEDDTPQQLNKSSDGSVDLLNSSNESDSPKIERKNHQIVMVLQSSSSETEMVSDSPDETDDD